MTEQHLAAFPFDWHIQKLQKAWNSKGVLGRRTITCLLLRGHSNEIEHEEQTCRRRHRIVKCVTRRMQSIFRLETAKAESATRSKQVCKRDKATGPVYSPWATDSHSHLTGIPLMALRVGEKMQGSTGTVHTAMRAAGQTGVKSARASV